MKVLDNNVTREMTEEEIEQFLRDAQNLIKDETAEKARAYDILIGVGE